MGKKIVGDLDVTGGISQNGNAVTDRKFIELDFASKITSEQLLAALTSLSDFNTLHAQASIPDMYTGTPPLFGKDDIVLAKIADHDVTIGGSDYHVQFTIRMDEYCEDFDLGYHTMRYSLSMVVGLPTQISPIFQYPVFVLFTVVLDQPIHGYDVGMKLVTSVKPDELLAGMKATEEDIQVAINGLESDNRLVPDIASTGYVETLLRDPDPSVGLIWGDPETFGRLNVVFTGVDGNNFITLYVRLGANVFGDAMRMVKQRFPEATLDTVDDFVIFFNELQSSNPTAAALLIQMLWQVKANMQDLIRLTLLVYEYNDEAQSEDDPPFKSVFEVVEPTYTRNLLSDTNVASIGFHDNTGTYRTIPLTNFTAALNYDNFEESFPL